MVSGADIHVAAHCLTPVVTTVIIYWACAS